jgi:uncharacterized repeat protein (TIGR02543 family)
MMNREKSTPRAALAVALLATALAAPTALRAQTVTIYGAPGNFDALNDTGKDAHGFQIELQGIPETTQVGLWQWSRFPGRTIPIPGVGVLLRWESSYTNGAWDVTTVTPAVFAPTFGHSCVQGAIAGCEHFGYYPAYGGQPTATVMTWLVEDPQNPGTLIGSPGSISIPMPKVTLSAGAVQFEINAPKPKQFLFGDAQWVKVLKNEAQHAVVVDELLEDNPVVPNDGNANQVETAWKLLQFNPHSANSGVLRNQANMGGGAKAVVRKYEFYKFSGQYDPIDHGAICGGDGLCNAPLDGELGDFIGTQMAAANVGVTGVTLAKAGTGSGTVTGPGINCGGSCVSPLAVGTTVTLTAKPDSKSTFTGWTGDCVGTSATCTFIITGENNVTATFAAVVAGGGGTASSFKISISKNGKGTVTANPSAASYASGTVVILTAIPDAGQPWVGWAGACSGTATTCTLTMTANMNVTANFR